MEFYTRHLRPLICANILFTVNGFQFDLRLTVKVPIIQKLFSAQKNLCVLWKKILFFLENLIFYAPSEKIRTTELVKDLGLFLGWRHKLFCMHVYKELMLCKWIYDINPGIDPGPSQARSCEFFRWFSVTLTAHQIEFSSKNNNSFTILLTKTQIFF